MALREEYEALQTLADLQGDSVNWFVMAKHALSLCRRAVESCELFPHDLAMRDATIAALRAEVEEWKAAADMANGIIFAQRCALAERDALRARAEKAEVLLREWANMASWPVEPQLGNRTRAYLKGE